MAKILLIGGTGAIGEYLAEELTASGHEVVVTSRRSRSSNRVRYAVGNGRDISFAAQVLKAERPDAVVDFMIYSTDEFRRRYDLLLSETNHYLFTSSYRVFAEEIPLSERSPRLLDVVRDAEYLNTDEYALAKARCENLLRESGKTNWTILRPSITYSRNRFQFGCLEANIVVPRSLAGMPVVMPTPMLDKRTTMSWSGDVAKMISRLILNSCAYGEDFNVVTSESHTWREVAEIYQKEIGMTVREVSLSDYCEVCYPYQVKYDRMFDRVMDNRKVLSATGLRQEDFTPLAKGLGLELERVRMSAASLGIDVRQAAVIDRLCKTRTPLSNLSIRDKMKYMSWRYPMLGGVIRRLRIGK